MALHQNQKRERVLKNVQSWLKLWLNKTLFFFKTNETVSIFQEFLEKIKFFQIFLEKFFLRKCKILMRNVIGTYMMKNKDLFNA